MSKKSLAEQFRQIDWLQTGVAVTILCAFFYGILLWVGKREGAELFAPRIETSRAILDLDSKITHTEAQRKADFNDYKMQVMASFEAIKERMITNELEDAAHHTASEVHMSYSEKKQEFPTRDEFNLTISYLERSIDDFKEVQKQEIKSLKESQDRGFADIKQELQRITSKRG